MAGIDDLEEIVVRLLNPQAHDNLNMLSQPYLLLNVHNPSTIYQLKCRLRGMTAIEVSDMFILYCGTVLNDKMIIPVDAFEATAWQDEDSSIFRPRIILKVNPSIPISSETHEIEKSENGDNFDGGSLISLTDSVVSLEGKQNEQSIQMEQNIAAHSFDLLAELSSINCQEHYHYLQKQGYDNEGAFANLKDTDLQVDGIKWVPHRATLRILQLAAVLKSRLAAKMAVKKISHAAHKGLIASAAVKGDNAVAPLQSLIAKPRRHKKTIQTKINIIRLMSYRRANVEDSATATDVIVKCRKREIQSLPAVDPLVEEFHLQRYDCKATGTTISTVNRRQYCCKTHEELVSTSVNSINLQLAREARLFIDVIVSQVPSFEMGYISREALLCSGVRALRDCGGGGGGGVAAMATDAIAEDMLRRAADESLLDLSAQRQQLLFSQRTEVTGDAGRGSALPVVWYDRNAFCAQVVALLLRLRANKRNGAGL